MDRAHDFGDMLGAEARARGKDVILGPGINLIRTPLCGRNFEDIGEDPLHVAPLAVAAALTVQTHDVAGSVKHFALTNQELNRNKVNFAKVHLEAGQTERIRFTFGSDSLRFWNIETNRWNHHAPNFRILIGASATDIRLTGVCDS